MTYVSNVCGKVSRRVGVENREINTYTSKITNCQIWNIATSHLLPIDMALLSRLRHQKFRKISRESAN